MGSKRTVFASISASRKSNILFIFSILELKIFSVKGRRLYSYNAFLNIFSLICEHA